MDHSKTSNGARRIITLALPNGGWVRKNEIASVEPGTMGSISLSVWLRGGSFLNLVFGSDEDALAWMDEARP